MFMLSFLACFSKTPLEKAADMTPPPQLLSEIVDENLITQKIDVNGDGKPDVFNDYKVRDDNTRILIHKTVDLNWDGKVDIETWFSIFVSAQIMDPANIILPLPIVADDEITAAGCITFPHLNCLLILYFLYLTS